MDDIEILAADRGDAARLARCNRQLYLLCKPEVWQELTLANATLSSLNSVVDTLECMPELSPFINHLHTGAHREQTRFDLDLDHRGNSRAALMARILRLSRPRTITAETTIPREVAQFYEEHGQSGLLESVDVLTFNRQIEIQCLFNNTDSLHSLRVREMGFASRPFISAIAAMSALVTLNLGQVTLSRDWLAADWTGVPLQSLTLDVTHLRPDPNIAVVSQFLNAIAARLLTLRLSATMAQPLLREVVKVAGIASFPCSRLTTLVLVGALVRSPILRWAAVPSLTRLELDAMSDERYELPAVGRIQAVGYTLAHDVKFSTKCLLVWRDVSARRWQSPEVERDGLGEMQLVLRRWLQRHIIRRAAKTAGLDFAVVGYNRLARLIVGDLRDYPSVAGLLQL